MFRPLCLVSRVEAALPHAFAGARRGLRVREKCTVPSAQTALTKTLPTPASASCSTSRMWAWNFRSVRACVRACVHACTRVRVTEVAEDCNHARANAR